MKEIGGYIELDTYGNSSMHENAIKLNTARNCLAYLIEAKKIKRIALPKFLCDSVAEVCNQYKVEIRYYSIDRFFKPKEETVFEENEWLYLVNYYGQLTNSYIAEKKAEHEKLVVDNVQAFYQKPVQGVDTLYTCRKFFGVSDGAFLYTDTQLNRQLEVDFSYERIRHVMGRYEKSASEFYKEYVAEEKALIGQPIKIMSRLTNNLLHAINYEEVKRIRIRNYNYLQKELSCINGLQLENTPEVPFMYPLYVESGDMVRKRLQKLSIFIPTLWPNVLETCNETDVEYKLAQNILPLPIDQRYTMEDMNILVRETKRCID